MLGEYLFHLQLNLINQQPNCHSTPFEVGLHFACPLATCLLRFLLISHRSSYRCAHSILGICSAPTHLYSQLGSLFMCFHSILCQVKFSLLSTKVSSLQLFQIVFSSCLFQVMFLWRTS